MLSSYFLVLFLTDLRQLSGVPVSRTVWIMLKISAMVVLSAPFNPNPMYLLLPRVTLYLTHPAVTNVTCSVKYKHEPNIWHGKNSLSMDLSNENILLFTNYNIVTFLLFLTISPYCCI